MADIKQSRILIIAANGFEQSELEVPRDKLRAEGATVDVASPDGWEIRGWDKKNWGRMAPVNLKIADANPADPEAFTAEIIVGPIPPPPASAG